ncbi:hypothetical protein SAMN02745945_00370 [Peptoclostridium litorale DSM 5388]|uniref:Uncharacterized protein n=1 Tax=Peptoclostridium litorale DSM 5388 TaxID=1121324 RepID=A0A069RDV9_PEPLI|nr:hypothetical protein [Peptoclostridium litorale]KDR95259.1 hypothetical protein CLIT_11c02880 [Peptoclostridium litorale DSM 5388]SIN72604.1 hypothetical protein SAMN02745945_00370 [Peptoclostridium litorale DSM 5388]
MNVKEQQAKMFSENIAELEKSIEQLKSFAVQSGSDRQYIEEIASKAKKNTKILSMFKEI